MILLEQRLHGTIWKLLQQSGERPASLSRRMSPSVRCRCGAVVAHEAADYINIKIMKTASKKPAESPLYTFCGLN